MNEQDANTFAATFQQVKQRIEQDILTPESGKNFVEELLIALFCGGHVLLEGLPGLGKTQLVRSVGEAMGLKFGRVQFTPDLMPADITGTQILQPDADGRLQEEFRAGPAFVNVLLADEINRASPKTQSALLEMMGERQITVAGNTYRPGQDYAVDDWSNADAGVFHVLATQNPIEQEGTYPLPEAQLDRFFFKLLMPFPDQQLMQAILEKTTSTLANKLVEREDETGNTYTAPAFSVLQDMQRLTMDVVAGPSALEFASALVLALNPSAITGLEKGKQRYASVDDYLLAGPSPRGGQALILGAKAKALLDGRPNIDKQDIANVAIPALRHRLVLGHRAWAEGLSPDGVIKQAIQALDGSLQV